MAQHDIDVANAGGAAFRADTNAALQALVTNSSGATAPATTYAYQWWADTTTGILKQRNSANSGWINILKLSTGAPVAAAPRATRIDVASATTLDLTANAPDTDDIRLTGTAAVTLVTIAAGRVVRVVAGGDCSFANNANIVTQRGATLQLALGDTLELRATADNVVEVLGYVPATPAAPSTVGSIPSVRQTVLSGPVDSNGFAAFGGSVGSATLTASGTLVATCGAGGNTHRTGSITNPAWTAPGGSGTGFLFLAVDSAGVVTTNVRTLAPSYINGTGYSTTNGQFTFSRSENTGKAGNGSTAAQVYEVCVGECPFTSGSWSGTIVWYQLRGEYEAAAVAMPAASTAQVYSHRLGGNPDFYNIVSKAKITSAVAGCAVGDVVDLFTSAGGTGTNGSSRNFSAVNRNSATFILDGSGPRVRHATTGADTGVSSANTNLLFSMDRGWK